MRQGMTMIKRTPLPILRRWVIALRLMGLCLLGIALAMYVLNMAVSLAWLPRWVFPALWCGGGGCIILAWYLPRELDH
jgi:hypothetical protein